MAEIQEFPKSLYHKAAKLHEKGHVLDISDDVKGQVIAHNREEQDAFGSDYIEGPDFYAPKSDPKPAKAKGKKSEE